MVADLKGAAMNPFDPARCPVLVVKIGSSLLVEGDGEVRVDWLAGLAGDVAKRMRAGQRIVIVSSGAIALGARRLKLQRGGRASLADAQAAAATGQIELARTWADVLGAEGLTAAQMLLTLGDLEDRRRYLNAATTLDRLLGLGAVPVINENDSVATDEIRFGDNDRLAARVAQAARAGGVLILSDVDGLYDRNPAEPGAQHIGEVHALTDAIRAMADGSSASGMGTGGMAVKLEAARMASLAGISLAIVSGRESRPLSAYAAHGRGTIFHPARNENALKSWIGGRFAAHGALTVDAGAKAALEAGKSLLAAGVTGVAGTFERGDVVDIQDEQGRSFARGLSEYDASDVRRILGHRSSEIETILGYAPRSCLIHRDNMVLL